MAITDGDEPNAMQIALREATQALRAGVRGQVEARPLSPAGSRRFAADLSIHLDELTHAMRAAGLQTLPSIGHAQSLDAVAEQLSLSASLARTVAERPTGARVARESRPSGHEVY